MAKGDLLGRIDCPCCGTEGGMRITEDKNGSPFGYCDATCNAQFRVGGASYRVDQFYARHPEVKRVNPVTVTVTEPVASEKIPVTVTGGNGDKKKVPDYLAMMGVK